MDPDFSDLEDYDDDMEVDDGVIQETILMNAAIEQGDDTMLLPHPDLQESLLMLSPLRTLEVPTGSELLNPEQGFTWGDEDVNFLLHNVRPIRTSSSSSKKMKSESAGAATSSERKRGPIQMPSSQRTNRKPETGTLTETPKLYTENAFKIGFLARITKEDKQNLLLRVYKHFIVIHDEITKLKKTYGDKALPESQLYYNFVSHDGDNSRLYKRLSFLPTRFCNYINKYEESIKNVTLVSINYNESDSELSECRDFVVNTIADNIYNGEKLDILSTFQTILNLLIQDFCILKQFGTVFDKFINDQKNNTVKLVIRIKDVVNELTKKGF